MYILRLLARKDASSVIVAVVIGLSLAQLISTIGMHLNTLLDTVINQSVLTAFQEFSWRDGVFSPIVVFVIHMIVLEIVLQIILRLRQLFIKATTKK
jgi:hypothetical protein